MDHHRIWNRYRDLEMFTAPKKANSREPPYSQELSELASIIKNVEKILPHHQILMTIITAVDDIL